MPATAALKPRVRRVLKAAPAAATAAEAPYVPIPLHPDGHPRFARSTWPNLLVGTKVIYLTQRRPAYRDGVVLANDEDGIQLQGPSGKVHYQFDELVGVYWHPDETGEGLAPAEVSD